MEIQDLTRFSKDHLRELEPDPLEAARQAVCSAGIRGGFSEAPIPAGLRALLAADATIRREVEVLDLVEGSPMDHALEDVRRIVETDRLITESLRMATRINHTMDTAASMALRH